MHLQLPQITKTKQLLDPTKIAQLNNLKNNFRLSPATMAAHLDPTWKPTNYLLKLSSILAYKLRKGNARLLISIPPRHGKSKLGTEMGITWFLENFPHLHTVIATYGADLSTDFSRKIRDHFMNNRSLATNIRSDVANINEWETTKGGGCRAVGIGGALTGKGADLLVIDDYLKDIKEAANPKTLEDIVDWYKTVAYTRLHPNASVVIIATRWDYDDLIGHLIQEDEKLPTPIYDVINFPAIALENDILGRKPGDPLFPERFDIDNLNDKKRTLGSFFFDSLYQQRPIPKSQMIVKREWWEIITEIPNYRSLYLGRFWDLAASEDKGDYTAGALCGYDSIFKIFYILDMKRFRRRSKKVQQLILETAGDDGIITPIYIEQEPGASGKAIYELYADTVLQEFKTEPLAPSGQKTVRAQPLLAAAEDGRVKLLKGDWNNEFIDEITKFPRGSHDDQVDVAAHGYNKLVTKRYQSATWGRSNKNLQPAVENTIITEKANRVVFGRGP